VALRTLRIIFQCGLEGRLITSPSPGYCRFIGGDIGDAAMLLQVAEGTAPGPGHLFAATPISLSMLLACYIFLIMDYRYEEREKNWPVKRQHSWYHLKSLDSLFQKTPHITPRKRTVLA
jgi:hypothetical protein